MKTSEKIIKFLKGCYRLLVDAADRLVDNLVHIEPLTPAQHKVTLYVAAVIWILPIIINFLP